MLLRRTLYSRGLSSVSHQSFLSPLYGLSPSALDIYEAATAIARAEIAPHAPKWDETGFFPVETLRTLAASGFASMWVSEEFGGLGLSRADSNPGLEAIASACPSTAAYLSIHGMVGAMIDAHGTAEQKKRLLPDMCSMKTLSSYCLTEPGSGSDAASLTTSAVKDKVTGYYSLSGQKAFISGGGRSDLYLVMARTTPNSGPSGISAFVVEANNTPGLSFGANEKKMGWRNQPTAQVFFDNVQLPPSALLGGVEGLGFKMAMQALDGGRLSIASCSLGGATACFEAARSYVHTREQFGAPLINNQALAFLLTDMATKLFTARGVVRGASAAYDAKHPDTRSLCAMAKSVGTEESLWVIDRALQLHGGYGFLQSTNIERFYRDCRVHTILEGTSEIMRTIISKKL